MLKVLRKHLYVRHLPLPRILFVPLTPVSSRQLDLLRRDAHRLFHRPVAVLDSFQRAFGSAGDLLAALLAASIGPGEAVVLISRKAFPGGVPEAWNGLPFAPVSFLFLAFEGFGSPGEVRWALARLLGGALGLDICPRKHCAASRPAPKDAQSFSGPPRFCLSCARTLRRNQTRFLLN